MRSLLEIKIIQHHEQRLKGQTFPEQFRQGSFAGLFAEHFGATEGLNQITRS